MNPVKREEECQTHTFYRHEIKEIHQFMEETCVWKHVMDKEDRVTAPGDFIAASCSSGVHLHAQIHLHCFLKSSFLALQLARPPSDLSFEAERMFTRKPQRNKLVVCSQPSVQLQFTQR